MCRQVCMAYHGIRTYKQKKLQQNIRGNITEQTGRLSQCQHIPLRLSWISCSPPPTPAPPSVPPSPNTMQSPPYSWSIQVPSHPGLFTPAFAACSTNAGAGEVENTRGTGIGGGGALRGTGVRGGKHWDSPTPPFPLSVPSNTSPSLTVLSSSQST